MQALTKQLLKAFSVIFFKVVTLTDFEQVVERFKTKLSISREVHNFDVEELTKIINKEFSEGFAEVFYDLSEKLNNQVGSKVLSFNVETKDRFTIQGPYHRIFFQKSKLETMSNIVSVNIIPIYVWKGVTKHMGPITLLINMENNEIKWDISTKTVEQYAISLFDKLIDDKDFSM